MKNALDLQLEKEGYKEYTHKSGFKAWSIENLAEYSDEWVSN